MIFVWCVQDDLSPSCLSVCFLMSCQSEKEERRQVCLCVCVCVCVCVTLSCPSFLLFFPPSLLFCCLSVVDWVCCVLWLNRLSCLRNTQCQLVDTCTYYLYIPIWPYGTHNIRFVQILRPSDRHTPRSVLTPCTYYQQWCGVWDEREEDRQLNQSPVCVCVCV